jgi:hypothetical protein
LAQSRTPQGLEEELTPPVPRVNAPVPSFFGWPVFVLGLLCPGLGLFLRRRRWDALAVLIGVGWASGTAAVIGARLVREAAMAAGLPPTPWDDASLWGQGLIASVLDSSTLPWPLLALGIHVGAAWLAAAPGQCPTLNEAVGDSPS